MRNGKGRRFVGGATLVFGLAAGGWVLVGRAPGELNQARSGSQPAVVADLYMNVVTVQKSSRG
ncbi:MAG TPA: hypothetical protein VNL71_12495 [Chloroflexota bacterium]|nr:hypothetical protein [Chloroflexota bacterium]